MKLLQYYTTNYDFFNDLISLKIIIAVKSKSHLISFYKKIRIADTNYKVKLFKNKVRSEVKSVLIFICLEKFDGK